MRVPWKYTMRSLAQRRSRALLTILGIGAVVAVAVAMVALARGMAHSFGGSGVPDNVVAMQRGAFSPALSSLPRSSRDVIRYHAHLQQRGGTVLASPELVVEPWVTTPRRPEEVFMVVRGVEPVFFAVEEVVRVSGGVGAPRGNEVLLGRVAQAKLGGVAVGETIRMYGEEWRVAGLFTARGTVFESMILASLPEVMRAARRDEYSVFTLKVDAPEHAADLVRALQEDRRVAVTALREPDLYAAAGRPYGAISAIGLLIAFIVSLGAVFGTMNTMYAAVAGRLREIGALRAIGFSRQSILVAFLVEAVVLSGAGGILGVAVGWAVDGLRLDVRSASIPFLMGPEVAATGVLLSVLVGVIGGLLPARGAARLAIVDALRRT